MATEYLTLLADPAPEWWEALEDAASDVTVQRVPGESAGRSCWRITLQGEAEAVEALRNWVVRHCWAQSLNVFTV